MKEKEFFHHLHISIRLSIFVLELLYIKRKEKKFSSQMCCMGLYTSALRRATLGRVNPSVATIPTTLGPLFLYTHHRAHIHFIHRLVYIIYIELAYMHAAKDFLLIQRWKLLLECLPSFFSKIYRKTLCLYLRNINTFSFLSEKVTRKICLLEEKSLLFVFFGQFEFCENFPRGPSK